jgi:hypothetical protein
MRTLRQRAQIWLMMRKVRVHGYKASFGNSQPRQSTNHKRRFEEASRKMDREIIV